MVGEYALVIFLVLAAMTAITIYFKRAVQARIRDARYSMVSEVRKRTAGQYNGALYRAYEPYYTETDSRIERSDNQTRRLLPGPSSGIFIKSTSEQTGVGTTSVTAPPKAAR